MILDKIKDIDKEIDINEHKVEKFLLIFHTLIETVNSEEVLDNTDRIATDTILKIVLRLSELLNKEKYWFTQIARILKTCVKENEKFV